jgi:hypothetical protein
VPHKASKSSKPVPAAERDEARERDTSERRTLQHRLCAVLDGLLSDALLSRCSPSDGARLRHCAMPHAWLWLLVCPLERCLVLSNREMSAALRHQYGLPPVADATWHCKCGCRAGAGHFHACKRVQGPATLARHEAIVTSLANAATAPLGMWVTRQPVMSFAERAEASARKRVVPDILFSGAELSLATDVSVLYGEADSQLQVQEPVVHAKKRLVSHCAEREKAKHSKYQDTCKAMHSEFKPFVVESHGFLAPSAQAVLNDLAQYAQDVLGLRAVEMAGYLKRRVAIAIQRGNAALDRTALFNSRDSYGAAVAMGMVNARVAPAQSQSQSRPNSAARRRSRSHSFRASDA